jgi:hypothetical protein
MDGLPERVDCVKRQGRSFLWKGETLLIASGFASEKRWTRWEIRFERCASKNGWLPEKRPPRIAYNASGTVGPTQDASRQRPNSDRVSIG